MPTDKQPGQNLLFSELMLAAIPAKKFNLDSWSSIDRFMDYAAELFGFTIKKLIDHGYLKITESEKIPVKFLGIRISSRTELLIHRLPKTTKGLTVGWLEEKILNTLKSPQKNQLKTLAFTIFHDILCGKDTYTNPGKVFIYELLKHQKLDRFRTEEKKTLLSKKITVIPNEAISSDKDSHIYVHPSNSLFIEIISAISSQLHRFQDSD